MTKLAKRLIISLIVIFVIFSLISIALLIVRPQEQNDADVLYGAEKENGYPYVGYLIIENTKNELNLCGVNFMSSSIGLTAAHCVDDFQKIYANSGTFTKSYQNTSYKIVDASISPLYKQPTSGQNAGISDVAVIQFAQDAVISEYPKIGTPSVGCNYYMVGYGRNEDKQQFDRRSTTVCIESLDSNRVILKKGDSFFCNGDSGSGIYEKTTNKIVAVISSYAYSGDGGCVTGTSFFATRLDTNSNYLSQYLNLDNQATNQVESNSTRDPIKSDDSNKDFNLDPQRDLILTVFFIGALCAGCTVILLILLLVLRKLTRKQTLVKQSM